MAVYISRASAAASARNADAFEKKQRELALMIAKQEMANRKAKFLVDKEGKDAVDKMGATRDSFYDTGFGSDLSMASTTYSDNNEMDETRA